MDELLKWFTEEDLVNLAYRAESLEREATEPELRKAAGAIRQGADWLLRWSVKRKLQSREEGLVGVKSGMGMGSKGGSAREIHANSFGSIEKHEEE